MEGRTGRIGHVQAAARRCAADWSPSRPAVDGLEAGAATSEVAREGATARQCRWPDAKRLDAMDAKTQG